MKKISAVYKIMNEVTGDFYIGSSKNVKSRWGCHKCTSTWNACPNNPMYLDMQKYGIDKFEFQILEEVEPEQLKEKEQQFIETLKPTYNNYNAKGLNIERQKEYMKKYNKEYRKEYNKSEKYKEYMKKYQQSEKHKEYIKKYQNKYYSQLCEYNGETLTLKALICRFQRAGIEYPTLEAKKYLITTTQKQNETE